MQNKKAGNFGNSEDIKREFAAKWGVDYKTNRLIPPALAWEYKSFYFSSYKCVITMNF